MLPTPIEGGRPGPGPCTPMLRGPTARSHGTVRRADARATRCHPSRQVRAPTVTKADVAACREKAHHIFMGNSQRVRCQDRPFVFGRGVVWGGRGYFVREWS